LFPLLYPYYEQSLNGTRSYDEVRSSIPYLASYFFADSGTILWGFLTTTAIELNNWWDHLLFPGGMAIICMVIFPILGVKYRKDPLVQNGFQIFFTLIFILILTLQYKGFSLYEIPYRLPGFSAMRSVGRIINVELFLFAYIVSVVLVLIYKRIKQKRFFLVSIALLCVLDHYKSSETIGTYNKKFSQERVGKVKQKLIENNYQNYNAFAYMPDDKSDAATYVQLDAMLASQSLNIPTINGYTATAPEVFDGFWGEHDAQTLHLWLRKNKMDIWKNKILLIK
jgi:hypothetical protein